jgi:flagellar M-ring protein FliF
MLQPIQKQFSSYWTKQSRSQRIVIIALLVAAVVLVPVLVTWASAPSYQVAYKGLSEEDAAAIVEKMDESGITYRLADGGTILVPSSDVYKARLQMASAGLPKTSNVGYELFDQNTLGMTEFTQKINYQRAMEGELERTIGSLDGIEVVRVHLVTPEKTLLSADQDPTTASVTVKMKIGRVLDAAQVRAITHLIASSVQGMTPESVVVVDSEGNMLSSGDSADSSAMATQGDSQRATEAAAAADVRQRVQAMLDRSLGPNKAIVQAAVAMDWSQKEITSNTYNPTPAAVRSSQKVNEAYNTNGDSSGGIPGSASNLPTPVPQTTGTPNATYYTRSEETINYEISQVQSKEIVTPGRVSRVTVSVMVDSALVTDQDQIDRIKSAVSNAAGVSVDRGDSVVVEAIPFDRTYYESQTAELEQSQQMDLYTRIGLIAAAVLVLALVFWYFNRLIRNLRKASKEAWRPILKPVGELTQLQAASGAGMTAGQFESGMSMMNGGLQMGASAQAAGLLAGTMGSGMSSSAQPAQEDVVVELTSARQPQYTPEDEQRAKLINKMAEENPAQIAEIIQIWLNEDERKNV